MNSPSISTGSTFSSAFATPLHRIIIDNITFNTPILRRHLLDNGSIAQLPLTTPGDEAGSCGPRRILRLLGQLYRNILEAFLETTLLLHEQLTCLSAAAHMTLALYASYSGNFVPIQLFFDVMVMIKNVSMCIANTQVDDPDGLFWIILLGTDALEEVFGKVCTMPMVIGNINADQLQSANCINGAVECARILAATGGSFRRSMLKCLQEQGVEEPGPHQAKTMER